MCSIVNTYLSLIILIEKLDRNTEIGLDYREYNWNIIAIS